jgi:hypothetical protein
MQYSDNTAIPGMEAAKHEERRVKRKAEVVLFGSYNIKVEEQQGKEEKREKEKKSHS